MLPLFGRWCRRYAARFPTVSAAFHTTAWLNAAPFSVVVVRVTLFILLLLVPPFTLRLGKCSPFFDRWGRRYAAHFTAVGTAFDTTARVNAARFLAVGVGVMLPILLLSVPPLTLRLG